MAGGQDSRDPAHIPQFNFTQVEVRPGEGGTVSVTVMNRYNQTMYSLQLELSFQVGGEWRNARPVSEIADPPRFTPSGAEPPHDLAPGASVTVHAPFTTAEGTPEGVYLVSMVARFSYTDDANLSHGAILKSLGTIAMEGRQDQVNMSDYTGTLDGLGIDGVAPDTSILVDSHSGEALFWQAVVAGVVVVAVGYGAAEWLSRRSGGKSPPRRKRR